MKQALMFTTGLAILVSSGIVHRSWTNNWSDAGELKAAADKLDGIAMSLGDWEGTPSVMDERAQAQAGIKKYVQCAYKNRRTNRVITVLLVCGRPGPIAVHTPEICYAASGYRPMTETVHQELDYGAGEPAQFWTAKFRKDGATSDFLRIFWTWCAQDKWEAPENPRLAFAPHKALYKLYVIRHLPKDEESPDDDECQKFIPLLLTELRRCFAAP